MIECRSCLKHLMPPKLISATTELSQRLLHTKYNRNFNKQLTASKPLLEIVHLLVFNTLMKTVINIIRMIHNTLCCNKDFRADHLALPL